MDAAAASVLPLKRYAVFHGRSTRTELLSFYVLVLIASVALGFAGAPFGYETQLWIHRALGVFLLCPSLAVGVRRMARACVPHRLEEAARDQMALRQVERGQALQQRGVGGIGACDVDKCLRAHAIASTVMISARAPAASHSGSSASRRGSAR